MPELPEVETVRKILLKNLKGRTITDCLIFWNKIIKTDNPEAFREKVIGQTINDVERMGKHLLIILDDYVLISHLRMEGKYYFNQKDNDGEWKHIMVVFELDGEMQLRYHDTRKFGTMHLYDKVNYLTNPPLNKLGLEPFDQNITVAYLKKHWANKNQPIKTTLLEQNVIVGIGNIYANEILFASKLHPGEKTKNLDDQDYQNIIDNTRAVLAQAIAAGGTTISTYHPEPGIDGKFVNELQVHGQAKKACPLCATTILKIFINGRGTYYCPHCQKLK
ncbi:formamidopyrimidine-DNA glycosylase [Spiroplasma syrphidicola EA-1]|uniref:Formamidopyrimidine-DNA glycosylase n=1 Tax=Spiroplasma syrphidicola EA-1 TaxID=1276229 RepID=R4UMW3_9MOLU|nr:DNA-formamidopyrimidine glycosylase [Spiroplasma syrphidicola]AGM26581.1 formamidopyrimidine-DNA glycosylase [Spiroplasma syrphidicola EA-1]